MEAESFIRSPKRTHTYLYQSYIIKLFLFLLIIGGLTFLWFYLEWRKEVIYVLALITLFTTISYLVYPHFFYLYTQYQVRHRQIMIKRHVWFQKTEVIKLERIQFVKRSSGPLLRHHNLCILTLTTAAHEVKFPYLSVDEAKRLESYCLNHIKRGDDDV